jgi:hypothetical protein
MTCRKLNCLLFGHSWANDAIFRTYGTKMNFTYNYGVETPSTGFQLFCMRSGKWVKVSRFVFNKFYDKQKQLEPMVECVAPEDSTDLLEGRCYYGDVEDPDNY